MGKWCPAQKMQTQRSSASRQTLSRSVPKKQPIGALPVLRCLLKLFRKRICKYFSPKSFFFFGIAIWVLFFSENIYSDLMFQKITKLLKLEQKVSKNQRHGVYSCSASLIHQVALSSRLVKKRLCKVNLNIKVHFQCCMNRNGILCSKSYINSAEGVT